MVGFLRRAFDFVARPTHSRTMGLVVMLVLVAAVSLTVIVAQQQQQLKQRAANESLAVCSSADSIPTCSSDNPANNSCVPEGDKCKIGNTIYECKR